MNFLVLNFLTASTSIENFGFFGYSVPPFSILMVKLIEPNELISVHADNLLYSKTTEKKHHLRPVPLFFSTWDSISSWYAVLEIIRVLLCNLWKKRKNKKWVFVFLQFKLLFGTKSCFMLMPRNFTDWQMVCLGIWSSALSISAPITASSSRPASEAPETLFNRHLWYSKYICRIQLGF